MKVSSFFVIIAMVVLASQPVQAEEAKGAGLFINLSSGDTDVLGHAMHMSGKMVERGHPVVFFLNGNAVFIASKKTAQPVFQPSGKDLRAMLEEHIAKGSKVIVCQLCMERGGMDEKDLIKGAVKGSPERVAEYLFAPNFKVIGW
jgi:predicted peroxiredoxin